MQVIEGGLPWLHAAPVHLAASVLRRLAAAGWTAADVAAHVQARHDQLGYTPIEVPARPAAYLRWLLATADPAHPPVQQDRQAAEARRDQDVQARRERAATYAASAADSVPATASSAADQLAALRARLPRPGHRARRDQAAELAARRDQLAARTRPTGLDALTAAVAGASGQEMTCVAGCHTSGPDVEFRETRGHLSPAVPPVLAHHARQLVDEDDTQPCRKPAASERHAPNGVLGLVGRPPNRLWPSEPFERSLGMPTRSQQ